MIEKVKCPDCIKEKKTSRVYIGESITTLMYFQPYYDEEGNYHHDDKNIHTTQYRCSNGHLFVIRSRDGKIIDETTTNKD